MSYVIFCVPNYIIFVGKGILRELLNEPPILSFEYDFLNFDTEKNMYRKVLKGEETILSELEIRECYQYCIHYKYKIWKIGEDGTCIGEGVNGEWDGPYAHCSPPNLSGHHYYNFEKYNWDYIYGVDAEGKYLGNVPFIECTYFATEPAPPIDYYRWDNEIKRWVDNRSIEEIKQEKMIALLEGKEYALSYGLIYKSYNWGCTQQDIDTLNSLDDSVTVYKDFDGEDVDLEGFTVSDIKNAILTYIDEVNEHFANLEIQLNNAETKEEIKNLVI